MDIEGLLVLDMRWFMDDREFASEAEFFDGVRADGSRVQYPSRHLYVPAQFEDRDPIDMDRDELRYLVKLQELNDIELVQASCREMIQLGMQAARSPAGPSTGSGQANGRESGAGGDNQDTAATTQEAPSPPRRGIHDDDESREQSPGASAPGLDDSRPSFGGGDLRARLNLPRATGEGARATKPAPNMQARAEKLADVLRNTTRSQHGKHAGEFAFVALKPEAGMVLVQRAGRLLLATGPRRTELALELVEMATALDTRRNFLLDRAHSVVFQTLLHLDDQYVDLGFGSWMPFRWPDQWLSFCGIMTRVLAANGLMHGKHADTYRRLLDETPPVEVEGDIHERIKRSRTPRNDAKNKQAQGASTLDELRSRLKREVWTPAEEKANRPFTPILKGTKPEKPPP